MRNFEYVNAESLEEAAFILRDYGRKARVIAGGTDILGEMKDDILPEYPNIIVNIKSISGLDYIKEEGGKLHIGTLTRLEDIANNTTVKEKYALLAEAARKTASPHIREMGTIGGNICQSNRCWYYWVPDNRFYCIRKGGKVCYALTGDARYHSIFGATRVDDTSCSIGCPDNVNIPSYLAEIREGNVAKAAAILLECNPLPAITGRVCPHFCENECNRSSYDESVSIRCIERFMGDFVLENSRDMYESPQREINLHVAIIGSGPAGLSAAYYLRCLGYKTTIIEGTPKAGGMLKYGIPPYRLPKEVVDKQVKALEGMGIHIKFNVEVGKDIQMAELVSSYDAVFLACGAGKERPVGIKGEQFMLSGIEFLRNVNSGTQELPGGKVAVIGGGNVAIDVARTLLRLGSKPQIIYRRSRAEMPALKEEIEKAEQEGIKFQFLTSPVAVSKKCKVLFLKCERMKLGPVDKTGRPQPVPISGSEFTSEFDAVIKATGEEPDFSFVPGEYLNKEKHLKLDQSTYSLGKNVFAGGDFVTGPATVVAAIAAGRKAAGTIDRYLSDTVNSHEKKDNRDGNTPEKLDSSYFKNTGRTKPPELPAADRIKSMYIEDTGSLDLSTITKESIRCFNCGCVAVNSSDIAPALIALDARIKTTGRIIAAESFFTVAGDKTTVLDNGEIVIEIEIPEPDPETKFSFTKFALRKSIDFPVVNCAAAIQSDGGLVKAARICLNSVYNQPYRATGAEEYILGKPISEPVADSAADISVKCAFPLINNKYKIQIARTLVKRAILACRPESF
jgi:NADPH-dependent glutamate synthase beta subunit-like oxidoreductase/CO/xanthine dehydrogenase FAD-binding subunit